MVVKQEDPEVPNKDPKGFQTLKLSAQSSSSAVPVTQKPAVVVGPTTPKPTTGKRGDAHSRASIPTQPTYVTARPVAGVWRTKQDRKVCADARPDSSHRIGSQLAGRRYVHSQVTASPLSWRRSREVPGSCAVGGADARHRSGDHKACIADV